MESDIAKTAMDVAVVLVKKGPPHGKVVPRRMQFPNDDTRLDDKPVFGTSVGMFVTNILGLFRSIVFGRRQEKYMGAASMQLQTGFFGDSGTLLLLKNESNKELEAFGVLTEGEPLLNSRLGQASLLPSTDSMNAARVVHPSEAGITFLEVEIEEVEYMIAVEPDDLEGDNNGVVLHIRGMEFHGVFYEKQENSITASDWIARYDQQEPSRRRAGSM